MSTIPSPVVGTPAPTPIAPAKPLTAIQIIEAEVMNYIRQREAAIVNLHAVDGAIQGAQQILAKLKAEAARAEAETKKILTDALDKTEAEVTKMAAGVEKLADNFKKDL